MSNDLSRFHHLADGALNHILEVVDDQAGDVLDADIQGGILTITLPSGGQYIVNKNAHLAQIWLSSPVSGAWHFQWDDISANWQSTRGGGEVLEPLLGAELTAATGRTVGL